MNSRKLFALFLVFALTGSALAAQQQRLFRHQDADTSDAEADDVTAVQQHSVFIEIVVQREVNRTEIHEFAAVVGLIKDCKKVRNQFDNAVLWFNDQFLFGEKDNRVFNDTDRGIGAQENVAVNPDGDNETENGFVGATGDLNADPDQPDAEPLTNPDSPPAKEMDRANNGERHDGTPRWGGCVTPDGFAHAIGSDDPFGLVSIEADAQVAGQNVTADSGDLLDGKDAVKTLIDLDNTCSGCIFEYQGSFFVVDPNGHDWIVDKHVYPLSIMGNLFQSGYDNADNTCGDDEDNEAVTPFSDLRDNSGHADRCEDDGATDGGNDDEAQENQDAENHCFDDNTSNEECDQSQSGFSSHTRGNTTLVEPLFSTHLQVNPATGLGFADKAPYKQRDTTTDIDGFNDGNPNNAGGLNGVEDVRRGMIYPQEGEVSTGDQAPNRDFCEENPLSPECSVEYNFLLAVDFAAFDDRGLIDLQQPAGAPANASDTGENEIARGCSVEHGQGGADQTTEPWQGNSHPANPEPAAGPSPQHCHPTVNLDIFFHDQAPFFTEEHSAWDANGNPVDWDAECQHAVGSSADSGDPVEQRTPIVCDVNSDAGEFHEHDGSETIRGN